MHRSGPSRPSSCISSGVVVAHYATTSAAISRASIKRSTSHAGYEDLIAPVASRGPAMIRMRVPVAAQPHWVLCRNPGEPMHDGAGRLYRKLDRAIRPISLSGIESASADATSRVARRHGHHLGDALGWLGPFHRR